MKKLLIAVLSLAMLLTTVPLTACKHYDYNVGILQVATHTALDNAKEGFMDTLNNWAKNKGKTIGYNLKNADGDNSNELTLAGTLVNESPDLVLGISTSSARALANSTDKIPVFYTAVTDPVGEGLGNIKDGGVRNNVTGTSDLNPVDKQIDLLAEMAPGCKKIGFLYNSSEQNSQFQFGLAKKACEAKGISIEKVTATASSDIQTAVQGMSEDIDAVYIPTDNLMAANMSLIASTLNARMKKVPAVAGDIGMCEDGEAVGTLGVDYYKLGVQTAEMAIKVLEGENPGNLPFEKFNLAPSFYINEKNAKIAGMSDELINSIKNKDRNK